MNSLERVMAAVRNGTPDRVPVVELAIDDAVIQQIMPGASWLDFYDQFDIDGVTVFYDLPYEDAGPDLKRDCFGVVRNFKEMQGHFPTPVEPLIKAGMDPMAFLATYQMPNPDDPAFLSSLRQATDRLKGRKAIVFLMHTSLIYPIFIRGFDNFLMDYYENPEFAYALSMKVNDFFIELEKRAIAMGADIVVDGEDYSGNQGLWMSVQQLKDFVIPGLREAIRVAKGAGVPFVKHCDGYMMPIMDLLVDLGIDCINPLEPAAGMDIAEVKQRYGKRVALWGNVDCSHLLPFGTTDEVRQATIECLRAASPGGGHILASSNTIHSAVPAENFLTMVETAREYGEYSTMSQR